MLSLLILTVATFIGTTLDNLLMLVVLRLSGTSTREVAGGFLAGSAVTLAACAAGTGLAMVLPLQHVGLLGIVPIVLGLVGLVSVARGTRPATPVTGGSGTLGIATTQVASSFDTLAAFVPLFADTVRSHTAVIVGGFALMTLAWLALSSVLARAPGVSDLLRPFERLARPVVLLLVGVYVLVNTTTDVEPDRRVEAGAALLSVTAQPGSPFSGPGQGF